jgi:hypothetical protein
MASSPVESARVGLFSVHTSDDIRDSSATATTGAAVIFGWVGSTPRLLKRYASLYLSACNLKAVYTVTADTVSVFMRPRRLRALMQSALAILEVGDGARGGVEGLRVPLAQRGLAAVVESEKN